MKKKLVTVFVIYFTGSNEKKMYLTGTSKRFDKKLIAEGWSENVDDAHTWNSIAEIDSIVEKLHNPHDRMFKSHSITVSEGNKSLILSGKVGDIS